MIETKIMIVLRYVCKDTMYAAGQHCSESDTIQEDSWSADRQKLKSISPFFEKAINYNDNLADDNTEKGRLYFGPLSYDYKVVKSFLKTIHLYTPYCEYNGGQYSLVDPTSEPPDNWFMDDWHQKYLLAHMYQCAHVQRYAVSVYRHIPDTYNANSLLDMGYFNIVRDIFTSDTLEDSMRDIKNAVLEGSVPRCMELKWKTEFRQLLNACEPFREEFRERLDSKEILQDFEDLDLV